MRPSALKVGEKYNFDGRVMTFVERYVPVGGAGVCIFQCEDYRGQYGSKDAGEVRVTDYQVSRKVTPIPI